MIIYVNAFEFFCTRNLFVAVNGFKFRMPAIGKLSRPLTLVILCLSQANHHVL